MGGVKAHIAIVEVVLSAVFFLVPAGPARREACWMLPSLRLRLRA